VFELHRQAVSFEEQPYADERSSSLESKPMYHALTKIADA
jgi:ethanolamine utilization protein EutP (predicted NTPase)